MTFRTPPPTAPSPAATKHAQRGSLSLTPSPKLVLSFAEGGGRGAFYLPKVNHTPLPSAPRPAILGAKATGRMNEGVYLV